MKKSKFKIEKTKDHLIVWRKPPSGDWLKWQNIPADMVKNFSNIKIKSK